LLQILNEYSGKLLGGLILEAALFGPEDMLATSISACLMMRKPIVQIGQVGARLFNTAYDNPGSDAVRWVFLGPPGVGKGTYTTRMAEWLGVPNIATGDLIRAEIKAGTTLGLQVWLLASLAPALCRVHDIKSLVRCKARSRVVGFCLTS
jgi:Adenylate kinase